MSTFESLLSDVRSCTLCKSELPHGVRPVLQIHPEARILIAGQAPGRVVHKTGIPFDDASGNRLREWMGLSRDEFYNPELVAILPMGFCYPGTGKSGDLPPRPECEVAWRKQLMAYLPNLKLTLVLGKYAQAYHFDKTHSSLTELVGAWQSYWPDKVPLPHPSPRNNIWLSKNPWFEAEVLPPLRQTITSIITEQSGIKKCGGQTSE